MNYAPIALFVYKRPDHIRRTVEALKRCPEFQLSPVYVFCDGPRTDAEITAVGEARKEARGALGERATFVESTVNRGLASSIISGVRRLCDQYGSVIVVEDDLVVSPTFLGFLNSGLAKYETVTDVLQISGHIFPIPEFADRRRAFFLPLTTSWGWATWRRAWDKFDEHSSGWERLHSDKKLRKQFNVGGAFDYFEMLCKQKRGDIDSWAVRWYWSVFANKGLVLYPPETLVENAGFDGSGTHGWRSARRIMSKRGAAAIMPDLPDEVSIDSAGLNAVASVLRKVSGNAAWRLLKAVKNDLSSLVSKRH